jgi:hypothetical protein
VLGKSALRASRRFRARRGCATVLGAGGCGEGVEMLSDPFKGTDLSALSVVERAQVDKLRRVCRDEGKEGLVRALVDLAKTNSALFMRLLREIIH